MRYVGFQCPAVRTIFVILVSSSVFVGTPSFLYPNIRWKPNEYDIENYTRTVVLRFSPIFVFSSRNTYSKFAERLYYRFRVRCRLHALITIDDNDTKKKTFLLVFWVDLVERNRRTCRRVLLYPVVIDECRMYITKNIGVKDVLGVVQRSLKYAKRHGYRRPRALFRRTKYSRNAVSESLAKRKTRT